MKERETCYDYHVASNADNPHVAVFACDDEGLEKERMVDIYFQDQEEEEKAVSLATAIIDADVDFGKLKTFEDIVSKMSSIIDQKSLTNMAGMRMVFRCTPDA